MVPIPAAIMIAMGHTDIKTTMIHVSLGKSHLREQVEKRKWIRVVDFITRSPPSAGSSTTRRIIEFFRYFADMEEKIPMGG